jgi:hypothetical protein
MSTCWPVCELRQARIFHLKKHKILWHYIKGVLFCGAMSSEHGNTTSSSKKSGRFLEQLYAYQLPTKASVLRCLFNESSEKQFVIVPVRVKIVHYISNNNNTILRNYIQQPYWALPTYCGQYWCRILMQKYKTFIIGNGITRTINCNHITAVMLYTLEIFLFYVYNCK